MYVELDCNALNNHKAWNGFAQKCTMPKHNSSHLKTANIPSDFPLFLDEFIFKCTPFLPSRFNLKKGLG